MPINHSPPRGRRRERCDDRKDSEKETAASKPSANSAPGLDDSDSSAKQTGGLAVFISSGEDVGRGVGRLDKGAYSPFGVSSRSNSVSGEDVASCKGGSGKPKCGKPVTDDDEGVKCFQCGCWFHIECENVTKTEYKAFGKHKRLIFLCTTCMQTRGQSTRGSSCKCSELQSQVNQLEGLVGANADMIKKALQAQSKEVNVKLNQLTDLIQVNKELIQKSLSAQEKVAGKQTEIQATLQENRQSTASYASVVRGTCVDVVDKVSAKIDSLPKHGSGASANTAQEVAGVLDDFMAKEKKKLNVIVHNVPESSKETHYQRCDEDGSMFQKIVRNELKLNVKITNAYRVGKKAEDKPRLLVITVEDSDSKHEILRMSSQLRDSANWSNVYITPDLTWKEREAARNLRQELGRRRANGEENLFIRQGKIVQGTGSRGVGRQVSTAQTVSIAGSDGLVTVVPDSGRGLRPAAQSVAPSADGLVAVEVPASGSGLQPVARAIGPSADGLVTVEVPASGSGLQPVTQGVAPSVGGRQGSTPPPSPPGAPVSQSHADPL